MTSYLLRRVSQSVAVLFIVSVIVFSILHFLPGSPARAMLGIRATPAAIAAFNKANGYNRALPVQYLLYLDRLFHGNLGFSYHFDQSVGSLLSLDLPKSAVLVGASYVVALLIAIPMGIVQAMRREKLLDHTLTAFSFVGYAMPTFWLGILLVIWFSADLHLFPSQGPQGATVSASFANPQALVLPVATLTIVTVAQFSRFMRASAVENLLQDYIRTARAKGLSNWRMVTRHLLRNSILPIITLVGLSLPSVLSGAIVVEALFNYPGMGWLFWTATGAHDFPVLMGFTIVIAAATVIGNLLADVAYAMADPRVRFQTS
jgi:peptide/nickel transport system permease protein